MITEFKDYRDLTFLSEQMQDELFKRHSHAEIENNDNPDQIVYTEKDVLILLQLLISDFNTFLEARARAVKPFFDNPTYSLKSLEQIGSGNWICNDNL